MRTEYFLFLGSLLIGPAALAGGLADYRPIQLVPTDDVGRLTLSEARHLVARSLLETGEKMVRVEHADYTGDGSVMVDVVTVQGVLFRHVLVDGKTHQIVPAKASG